MSVEARSIRKTIDDFFMTEELVRHCEMLAASQIDGNFRTGSSSNRGFREEKKSRRKNGSASILTSRLPHRTQSHRKGQSVQYWDGALPSQSVLVQPIFALLLINGDW